MKSEHFLIPYTKINSKWIKDTKVRPDTIKLSEKNIGGILSDINHSKIFFDPPPRVMKIKIKIKKKHNIKKVYHLSFSNYSKTLLRQECLKSHSMRPALQ